MTASLFETGTHVASVAHHPLDGTEGALAHAVARPVVDGLDQSVCGVLVSATADVDWRAVEDAPRCEECCRIAG
jgi:hypothetical protein